MSYDKQLSERITQIIKRSKVSYYEKEMMGGITWMVDEKMCISIYKGALMVRVDPDEMNKYLSRPGAERMMHGGKPMSGYLTIHSEGFASVKDLEYWVQQCLDFNPKARSSKKKKA